MQTEESRNDQEDGEEIQVTPYRPPLTEGGVSTFYIDISFLFV
jgi:hypothetical protein